jgi:large subunit ribosomal protein L6
MSRVAKKPVTLPKGVECKLDGDAITVKGSLGAQTMSLHPDVEIVQEDGSLRVAARKQGRQIVAMAGTTRALLANMVTGVSEGFEATVERCEIGRGIGTCAFRENAADV